MFDCERRSPSCLKKRLSQGKQLESGKHKVTGLRVYGFTGLRVYWFCPDSNSKISDSTIEPRKKVEVRKKRSGVKEKKAESGKAA